MLVETLQALLPLLCGGVILAGVAFDRRLAEGFPSVSDDAPYDTPPDDPAADEAFAFRLLAESLIGELGLRPECRDEVLGEMQRERELVMRWLLREAAQADAAATPADAPRSIRER